VKDVDQTRQLKKLQEEIAYLKERERDLAERNEELLAQKEELTAAIEAFIDKSDSLEATVQKLKQRNAELDQILYRTAHDLRAPLSSIEGLIYLAQLEGKESAYEKDTLHPGVLENVYQMKDVLKALSTLAHASFDKITYKQVKFHFLIENLIRELDYLMNFKFVDFKLSIDENLVIETDPFLFSIVAKALLTNALIFREPARNGLVHVIAKTVGNDVEVTVEDDGEGIPDGDENKIFDMFYRGSERSIGPGLGLYVSREIVRRFGGTLQITSDNGMTKSKIVFPAKKKEGSTR
jgi:signal transduction histidine kinase